MVLYSPRVTAMGLFKVDLRLLPTVIINSHINKAVTTWVRARGKMAHQTPALPLPPPPKKKKNWGKIPWGAGAPPLPEAPCFGALNASNPLSLVAALHTNYLNILVPRAEWNNHSNCWILVNRDYTNLCHHPLPVPVFRKRGLNLNCCVRATCRCEQSYNTTPRHISTPSKFPEPLDTTIPIPQ